MLVSEPQWALPFQSLEGIKEDRDPRSVSHRGSPGEFQSLEGIKEDRDIRILAFFSAKLLFQSLEGIKEDRDVSGLSHRPSLRQGFSPWKGLRKIATQCEILCQLEMGVSVPGRD